MLFTQHHRFCHYFSYDSNHLQHNNFNSWNKVSKKKLLNHQLFESVTRYGPYFERCRKSQNPSVQELFPLRLNLSWKEHIPSLSYHFYESVGTFYLVIDRLNQGGFVLWKFGPCFFQSLILSDE
jgi:hypothetical protein